ncbi:MAG: nucleotidyltransferase family protein [Paludibacteraceae bacterium]|nr:nucleotidyltransferase family protein [Paludibacteraceae bacterium]
MRYWELVKAALWGETAVWPEEETEALMQMHARQGTGALVYPMVLQQEGLSAATRTQMKAVCVSNMQRQVELQHTLETAWKALEEAGIKAVLLKGAGLAALYPEPQRRTWGDIDIFVGKEQYHPACAALRAAFPKAATFEEELEHYKHYNLDVEDVPIEVHRVTMSLQHPVDERRYERMEREGMEIGDCRLVIGDLEVRVPEETFNVLFVFLHSWEHAIGGSANVRQLCDLALLLHHYADRIDKERLRRWLKELHLLDVWQLYVYILQHKLGLPAQEALFSVSGLEDERMMRELVIGDWSLVNGVQNTEYRVQTELPKNRFMRKWRTMMMRFETAERVKKYSPSYARHMNVTTLLHGAARLFAKDRKWE